MLLSGGVLPDAKGLSLLFRCCHGGRALEEVREIQSHCQPQEQRVLNGSEEQIGSIIHEG
jgi:hypothetical protein